jgi:hypothetical protein
MEVFAYYVYRRGRIFYASGTMAGAKESIESLAKVERYEPADNGGEIFAIVAGLREFRIEERRLK